MLVRAASSPTAPGAKSSRGESAAERQNHENGVAAEKIGGANSAWITTGVISIFSSVFIIITIIKGE
jgi:hypothetical protein